MASVLEQKAVINENQDSFFTTILTPGSSLHPTFLLILDGAFVLLLCLFLSLLWLTSGSVHIIILIAIELALWASIKWFVNELGRAQFQEQQKIQEGLEDELAGKEKTL